MKLKPVFQEAQVHVKAWRSNGFHLGHQDREVVGLNGLGEAVGELLDSAYRGRLRYT